MAGWLDGKIAKKPLHRNTFFTQFVGIKRSIIRAARHRNFPSLTPESRDAKQAILQQSEASYTPQCDSEHTPEHEVLDTPLTP
jgi:hypothetical protein